MLKHEKKLIDWHKVVWFLAVIPIHSFVLWLAFHDVILLERKWVDGVTEEISSICSVC